MYDSYIISYNHIDFDIQSKTLDKGGVYVNLLSLLLILLGIILGVVVGYIVARNLLHQNKFKQDKLPMILLAMLIKKQTILKKKIT